MHSVKNKIRGVIGSLVGALLGIGVMCFFGKMGTITVVGGLTIAAGVFLGYFIPAKESGWFGVIFVLLLTAASIYIGVRLSYAMVIADLLEKDGTEAPLFKVFVYVEDMLEKMNKKSDYIDVIKKSVSASIGSFLLLSRLVIFFIKKRAERIDPELVYASEQPDNQ